MKKQVLSLIALLSLVVTLTIAGYADAARMMVNIPFDFTVGNKSLPAGHYTVARINGAVENLAIRSTEKGASATALTYGGKSVKAEAAAKLVFHRYGNTYYLAEVWEAGSDAARQLPQSRAERDLQKRRSNLAENTAQPEIVTILAQ